MATYENKIAKDFVIYGSNRLGIYNGSTQTGKRTLGNKKYELSNHLGNVLSVISDNKIGIDNTADFVADYYEPYIVSESDYYPYGMTMENRSFASSEYRFGMNGQEKSDEIDENGNSYTAEFWQYNAVIGRRWNVDPLMYNYPSNSPYSIVDNSPLRFVDLDGDAYRLSIKKDANGNYNITISTTVYIYGHDATKVIKVGEEDIEIQIGSELTKAMQQNWNALNTSETIEKDGVQYSINFDVEFKYVGDDINEDLVAQADEEMQKVASDKDRAKRTGLNANSLSAEKVSQETKDKIGYVEGDNFIAIGNQYTFGYSGNAAGKAARNSAAIVDYSFDIDGILYLKPSTALHEFGHLLGLPEGYDKNQRTYSGYTGDIMAADQANVTKIHSNHFYDWLDYVLNKYSNSMNNLQTTEQGIPITGDWESLPRN